MDPTRPEIPADLVRQLTLSTGLPSGVAARVVQDVLTYFDENLEAFVRRRHRELKRQGLTNDAIFEHIAAEVPQRRLLVEPLSARQLRRLVYG